MNFNNLINQVLGAAKQYGDKAAQSDTLTKLGGGAAVAGLLSMFLKKGKGQRIAHAGSMAALGALAYAAYQKYQQNQSASTESTAAAAPLALPETAFAANNDSENAGRLILRTMIAAAAADGSIDEAEQNLILQEGGEDAETRQWLAAEAARPAQPAEIAREIGGDTALAAEAYLAARLVCADLSRKEIVFLSQLSQALQLDDKLVDSLEKQAGF
ncbi:tellurite resistance TerB family protein [Helicobacter pylori]